MDKYLYFLVVFAMLVCIVGCGDNSAVIEISTNVSNGLMETNKLENASEDLEECR